MFRRALMATGLLACFFVSDSTMAVQSVTAAKYAVVSGHPEATAIGLQVLRQGGNVVDAAIATSFALGVAEPYGSGLGGKLILLYRDGTTGEVYSIVALCASPAELPVAEFVKLSSAERKYSYRAVGVPGLVRGLEAAFERWGSKPWDELVEPAAQLAEDGVTIDATMRGMFLPKVKFLRQDAEAAQFYLVNGEAPAVGTIMKNADLAGTLRRISIDGASAFYDGDIARRVVEASQSNGGWLSLDDFRNYQAEFGNPLSIDYRGYRIYSCPPPLTGGVTVLSTLRCVEQMRPNATAANFAAFTDDVCRSLQCLYPRIRDTIADVSASHDAAAELIALTTATQLANSARELDPRNPNQDTKRRPHRETTTEGMPSASTSHLVVVDREGNMVSLTQSLSLHFGASVIAPGTGFLLNDSMSNFATHSPKAVNRVAAGKRARSTIAPIIATKSGQPWLALGIPGGQRIPTTTLQLLWRLIDHREPLDRAFEASRFHLVRPLRYDSPENVIHHEADAPATWIDEMEAAGWELVSRRRDGHYFGGGGAAQYGADGTIVGVADPRRTNSAAGD
ncbi:MAG: gamma-glutamyltransferase family protein [Planctomycetota bacterium]